MWQWGGVFLQSSKAEQLVRAEQSKEVGDSHSRTTKEEALAREKEERVSKLSVWKVGLFFCILSTVKESKISIVSLLIYQTPLYVI